jgi:hypothetical protein
MASLNDHLKMLKLLNLEIRQRLELAEARVGPANVLLAQLAATKLMNDQILLGEVILQRPYSARYEPTGSGQVIQAVLAIPGEFGAVFWDSEELAQLCDTPQLEAEAIRQLIPFGDRGPAIKALLVSQLEPLLHRLLATLPSTG